MRDPRSELVGASPLLHARVTGAVGLILLVTGSFAAWADSQVIVRDDAAATAANLLESETLYRLGIASDLAMMVAQVFYALLLYGLFKPVDARLARAMLALILVSVPIYMLGQVHAFGALLAAREAALDQVRLFLGVHGLGNAIAGIFFGLWLAPLGGLALKSRFVPRALGWLLLLGSPGWLVQFVQAFFFPETPRTLWGDPLLVITHVSELALLFWLLVRGVSAERWSERAA